MSPSLGDQKNELYMKVPTGHPVQSTKEASAEVARGRALKSMHKSTVEKDG